MDKLKQNIAESISAATAEIWGENLRVPAEDIFGALEYPPDPNMGDLAFPCFKLSRVLRAGPPVIAGKLNEKLTAALPEGVGEIRVVGGYLNLFLDGAYLAKTIVGAIAEKGADFGAHDFGAGKTVVLDYSSPNVAKPFHIGHLGTTVIGHSLKMLHEYAGYHCIGINHLGDWGTQFGKLIVAYRKWGNKEAIEKGGVDELVALYVRINNEIKAEEEQGLTTLADASRAEFTKLEHHDEENLALWRWFIDISLAEYEKTYKQLGITFDSYNGEAFYTDKMPEQVQLLREKNLMKIDAGASIVDLSEYNMPPCLILKSDGSTLYPTRDIAAAVYRKRTYDFDKCIYVTSAGQSLHFAQWFKVVDLMGYDWADKLYHVPYGTVSIGGEKLATRTGNVILLRDLFATAIDKCRAIIEEKNPNIENKEETAEAVGVGAVIFYYLYGNRVRDINFVMEDALDFNGNTGPYAQYTYARTNSILEKAGDFTPCTDVSTLTVTEKELIKTLSLFPNKTKDAIDEMEPSIITRYAIDVCNAFNRFYQECKIVTCEEENTRAFRLTLTKGVHDILGRALELVCIKHPDKI
ncbi:MAG: arginine--tRNA ligase [Clostridia bacterium]|nr:arginine--tRNA ligase [Clostridia bacterium]